MSSARRQWAVSKRGNGRQHLGALALFSAISVLAFGLGALPDISHRVVGGVSDDAEVFLWMLRWWPYALGHGQDPLFSHIIFAPTGVNLAWATSVPLPSLLAVPLTLSFGVVSSFDVLSLLGPALAAFGGYLLCRQIVGAFWPSLAGGLLFGFSPYESWQLASGHLNLDMIVFVPLAGTLIVRRLQGKLAARPFVLLLAATLVGQFAISNEILATMTLMGVAALTLAVLFGSPDQRRRLRAEFPRVAAAYAVAGLLVAPYEVVAYTKPRAVKYLFATIPRSLHWRDLFRFVIPGTASQFRFPRMGGVGNPLYLGLPLLLILVALVIQSNRRRLVLVLVGTIAVAAVLSLGPSLQLGGLRVPLPWSLFRHLPLIRLAVPSRLFLFAYLAAGVCLALWLAQPGRPWVRGLLAAAAVIALVPNVTSIDWSGTQPSPPFFQSGQYRAFLSPNEIVAVVSGSRGDQMYWQAEAGMSFRLVGGFIGVTPTDYHDSGIGHQLLSGSVAAQDAGQLERFLESRGVGAVLVVGGPWPVESLLRQWDPNPRSLGGVVLYEVPSFNPTALPEGVSSSALA
jgi:hypothetical protein